MQRFRNLGVFLHDSPADGAALDYAAAFATLAGSESVHCVHFREKGQDEEDLPPVDDVKQAVLQRLPDAVAKITSVEVHHEAGVPEILRAARDKELDLIVVGRRLPSEQVGIGSAFARLARKSPCSVLVVPADARVHLERVFVPVDFSEHSKLAMDTGIAIARAAAQASSPQLVVHSNFTIGYGYSKLGLTLPQAVADRQKKVREQLETFVGAFDTQGFDIELVATSSNELDQTILESAVTRKMDLIVVGSRGSGRFVLLGSTAERVLMSSLLPVLVVKKKGETVHLLDALFGG